jgi:transposase-like protein
MIQESVTEGVTPVIRKHNVSQSLFHKWKKQFDLNGLAGFVIFTESFVGLLMATSVRKEIP